MSLQINLKRVTVIIWASYPFVDMLMHTDGKSLRATHAPSALSSQYFTNL